MVFGEKFGGAIGAFSNNNFKQGWEKFGSALNELFASDSKNSSPQRQIDTDDEENDSLNDFDE